MTNKETAEIIKTAIAEVEWEYPMEYAAAFDRAIEVLEQERWIPVSERLPEDGYWLWSAEGGEVKKDYYYKGHWKKAEDLGYKVLAWMPLPEPYKVGSEVEE